MEFVKGFLFLINIVSFIGVVLFGIIGFVEYFEGPIVVEKIIKKFNLKLNYKHFLLIELACIAVMTIAYIVRQKL